MSIKEYYDLMEGLSDCWLGLRTGFSRKGRCKKTNRIVAIKFMPKYCEFEDYIEKFQQDFEILRSGQLKHENIVEMIDFLETSDQFCVVTEFVQDNLIKIIEDEKEKKLSEAKVQAIAKQLVSGLQYLHSKGIYHRGLKPQNILVGTGSVYKISDFGFSRVYSPEAHFVPSLEDSLKYIAPELANEEPHDHNVDLWSLGAILYELFVGHPPYYGICACIFGKRFNEDPIEYPNHMSSNFKSFLKGLLNKSPESRLTWPALIDHPFIKETCDEQEHKELHYITVSPGVGDAAQRVQGNAIPTATGQNNNTDDLEENLHNESQNICRY